VNAGVNFERREERRARHLQGLDFVPPAHELRLAPLLLQELLNLVLVVQARAVREHRHLLRDVIVRPGQRRLRRQGEVPLPRGRFFEDLQRVLSLGPVDAHARPDHVLREHLAAGVVDAVGFFGEPLLVGAAFDAFHLGVEHEAVVLLHHVGAVPPLDLAQRVAVLTNGEVVRGRGRRAQGFGGRRVVRRGTGRPGGEARERPGRDQG
jgi:hypothetical protein